MKYYFSNTVQKDFDTSKIMVIEALKKEGFGIVSEIDLQSRIKDKLDIDFKKYTILGACNPTFAYKALLIEDKIGTMLPCNVVIIGKEDGTTEIAAIDPGASMMAIENKTLQSLAEEITEKLKKIIEQLE